ncbi:putative serine protease K12H4.7 [Bradysia coprophila]|uniref:putative serine protease K12H4.7 n=1 Tax=Bradysia coprophila TaxID=38358 RepID=UPI00187D8C02|nr:putative serine protease K12H4.7 [Bradysia coprophila]
MLILIFALVGTLSVLNGNVFAGDFEAASFTLSARGEFETRLDHFRPQYFDKVRFAYHVNTDYYQPMGPLYIYIKDARDYTTTWIESGLMVDIAAETNAALFTFDHRYLGDNRPTQNASFENLEYLSVEQSLADIATFIRFIRSDPSVSYFTKVILWGSGYGGSMATWARKKYPGLVDGVWSSSGIFDITLYSFSQYDALESIFRNSGSSGCTDLLREALFEMDRFIQNGEGEYLQERLNLCRPVDTNSMFDIAALYEHYILFVTDYINRLHTPGILSFCRAMEEIPGDAFDSFAQWVDLIYGTPECFDPSFDGIVERSSNVEWGAVGTDTGRRQWYYSQCTQIGSFLIADEFSWIPGRISVFYHMEKCQRVLGESYNANLLITANDALIRELGSLNHSVTNVIYTNGGIDPWLGTGIVESQHPSLIAMTIDTYAKSADLTSIDPMSDTELLVEAKQRIRETIIAWSQFTSVK